MKKTIYNGIVAVMGISALVLLLCTSDSMSALVLSKVAGCGLLLGASRLFERINGREAV